MTPDSLRVMARYNAWANARLYEACARAGEEECARPRPSFFGSILNTLNHVLVADMLWLGRFSGREATGITAVDQILHPTLAGLAPARSDFDAVIVAFFDALDGPLDENFTYRTLSAGEMSTHRGLTMQHMFNHATHHRGQVHGMLSATPVPPPPLDLVYFLRE